jgi:electron transport complex protein RnfD
VLALVSFPVEMTRWLVPADHGGGIAPFLATLQAKLGIAALPDLYSGATPLDAFRHLRGNAEAQAGAQALQGTLVAAGWEWVNLAFLAGGLYLLARRVITWHIPVAMLTALALLALPFWLADDTRYASPLFHLLTGGTMLGAFFIATDPVTAATSRTGRLIYAAAIGALVWTIRSLGGYPDAIAFSVLLLNLAAPAIDYYTQPRTYGHAQAARGLARKDGGK